MLFSGLRYICARASRSASGESHHPRCKSWHFPTERMRFYRRMHFLNIWAPLCVEKIHLLPHNCIYQEPNVRVVSVLREHSTSGWTIRRRSGLHWLGCLLCWILSKGGWLWSSAIAISSVYRGFSSMQKKSYHEILITQCHDVSGENRVTSTEFFYPVTSCQDDDVLAQVLVPRNILLKTY